MYQAPAATGARSGAEVVQNSLDRVSSKRLDRPLRGGRRSRRHPLSTSGKRAAPKSSCASPAGVFI